jgi:hypothetical protein
VRISIVKFSGYLIDVAQDNLLHSVMFENFTHYTAISTSDYKDLFWVGMTCHWQMGDHLLIPAIFRSVWDAWKGNNNSRKFVPFGALYYTIQYQDVPVCFRFKNKDILVQGLFDVQYFHNFQRHRLTRPLGGDLSEPSIYSLVNNLFPTISPCRP